MSASLPISYEEMEVYLIRHGIAEERTEYSQDEVRPLTKLGRQKTIGVAQKLANIGLRLDLILTSPLVRAHQTAEILIQQNLGDRLEEFAPLAPGGDIQLWLDWYTQQLKLDQVKTIALVGHQPDLGNWTEMLVWGNIKEQLIVKKAGVIGLRIPATDSPLSRSELFLLTSPKWLQ